MKINALIAYYETASDFKSFWNRQKRDCELAPKKNVDYSNRELKERYEELAILHAKKKNIKIAVNLINNSLRYVFFSKDRLELKVEK